MDNYSDPNKATKTVFVLRDWIGGSFPETSAFFTLNQLSKPVLSFESALTNLAGGQK